jgi:hypothetical protein
MAGGKASRKVGNLLEQMVLGGMEDDTAQQNLLAFQKNNQMSSLSSYKAAPWMAALTDFMTNHRQNKLQREANEEKKRNRNSMMEYAKKREEQEMREAEEARAEKARKEAKEDSWKEREFQLKSADQRSRERHRATMEGIAQKKSIYKEQDQENKKYEKFADKITDPQEKLRYLSNPQKYASQLRQKQAGGIKGLWQGATGFGKESNAYTLAPSKPQRPTGQNIQNAGRAQLLSQARKIKRGYF